MGWQGSATHRDSGAEPDTSPQIGTDGDIFYLPSPNAPSCIITDSATKKQEGADSSLVKASINHQGPEEFQKLNVYVTPSKKTTSLQISLDVVI